jgi:pimeloyl-ACP methyl ester carboxylesterase
MAYVNLYIFSGLGTDERIFCNIHFPEFVNVHFIAWKKPLHKETLDQYVNRLLKEVDQTKPIVFLGLSFGGIIAQEAAKKIKPVQTIIISSISSPGEIPWYFKFAGKLKLNRLIPFRLLKLANRSVNWFFSAKRGEDKKLMAEIIRDADVKLLKWSVEIFLAWKNKNPVEVFHIHGDKDRLLPLKNKKVNAIVKDGSHLMIFNRAEEVERLIVEAIRHL